MLNDNDVKQMPATTVLLIANFWKCFALLKLQ